MNSPAPAVVAIFGPTGVGKTDVAVELARLLRAAGQDPVAISADALQVYQGLGALTGAASVAQRELLEHRLQGFVPVTSTFSVGEFMPLAHREVDAALETGRRPLVLGGTGLYLRAAIAQLDLRPRPDSAVRARIEESLRERGSAALHAELRRRSPGTAARIEPGDRNRVVRALELLEMNARPAEGGNESQLWTGETRHPTLLVGLVMARDALYRRIDERVEAMVAAGAAEEVRRADLAGASITARKALGFQDLLRGDVEAMKRRTRNYAKRQLTWMRRLPNLVPLDLTGRRVGEAAGRVADLAGWTGAENAGRVGRVPEREAGRSRPAGSE